MRYGRYPKALSGIKSFTETSNLPLYWRYRLYFVASLCHQASGHYSEAQAYLTMNFELLKDHKFHDLVNSIRRLQLSLWVESERFQQALQYLDLIEDAFHLSASGMNRALLLRDKVRLFAAVGQKDKCLASMEQLESVIRHHNIPRTIIDPIEERSDCDLLVGPREGPSGFELKSQGETLRTKEIYNSSFVAFLHAGRRFLSDHHIHEALEAASQAIVLSEMIGAGKARARAYALCAMVHHALHDGVSASAYLSKALALALQLDLGVLAASLEILSAELENRPFTLSLMEALCQTKTKRPIDVRPAVTFFGWRPKRFFLMRNGVVAKSHEIDILQMVDQILGFKGLYWVKEYSTLYINREDGLQEFRIEGSLLSEKIIKLFLSAFPRGVRLSTLHQLSFPNLKYLASRDQSRCTVAISRARRHLKQWGLTIIHDACGDRYFLSPELENLWIFSGSKQKYAKKNSYEGVIVKILGSHSKMSLSSMAKTLGIKRQSLHPYIRIMESSGIVTCHHRGRSSYYTLTPHKSFDLTEHNV